MKYDVVVIGAGISGLTAAALLSKRGLSVAVVDKSYNPGGSCGIFKRNGAIFDQGSAMLYGFGESGFNAHRFIFNCLEEPFSVIRHELLYTVVWKGKNVRFCPSLPRFVEELGDIFPKEKENIMRFYQDMELMYRHVLVDNPTYVSADETDPLVGLWGLLKHPSSYIRFLSYLNRSAESILKLYFKDPEIFNFFDKLTSTYCYATVREAPAVMAAVMFVDNHHGGSYYPAGSTVFLPGKLEKVVEENGGVMLMERLVEKITFREGRPSGVLLKGGEKIEADNVIYSGTVWNLYGKLIDREMTSDRRIEWGQSQLGTYPSVVLYALVDKEVIPEGTSAIEMLIGNPDSIDESEVTAYISSLDDLTLCDEDHHVVMAIGPTFDDWRSLDDKGYKERKDKERERLLEVLEKRWPGFGAGVSYSEVATPRTIERYANKNGGCVAGPKQMLGQHMFKRLHIRSEWDNLFYCGESTVMGTGTPTVSVSGLSAANALLKKMGLPRYVYKEGMKDFIEVVKPPFSRDMLYRDHDGDERDIIMKASACQFCEQPSCVDPGIADIRGMMRRVCVGNFKGAKRIAASIEGYEEGWEDSCIENARIGKPVAIGEVLEYLRKREDKVMSKEKKGRIKIIKDGPYIVSGGVELSEKIITPKGKGYIYEDGEKFETEETYALCRCGKSKNHPFCDGSHVEAKFDGTEKASRAPYLDRVSVQEGPGIDLLDDDRCAFARFCHRDAGDVWELTDKSYREKQKNEAVIAAYQCPAGRLTARDKDGNLIDPEYPEAIEVLQDPQRRVSCGLFVKGGIPIESADGFVYEQRNRVVLCRCGHSTIKPFCDASHVMHKFKDK